jgi:hypothetical protein
LLALILPFSKSTFCERTFVGAEQSFGECGFGTVIAS